MLLHEGGERGKQLAGDRAAADLRSVRSSAAKVDRSRPSGCGCCCRSPGCPVLLTRLTAGEELETRDDEAWEGETALRGRESRQRAPTRPAARACAAVREAQDGVTLDGTN